MIAITVSTKYHDILEIIIHQNQKFFTKWYIITHQTDLNTVNVIQQSNYNNIEILYYNFYNDEKCFDKGGAIRFCQEKLQDEEEDILILDSDIYIPDEFEKIQKMSLKEDTLYGVYRHEYYTFENFQNNIIDHYDKWIFIGFFQLYKNNKKYRYEHSEDASSCDMKFQTLFPKKIPINDLIVKHLGRPRCNWSGRKKYDFF